MLYKIQKGCQNVQRNLIVCLHFKTQGAVYVTVIGCVFLGESKNGFVISDHSDHGASKEPTNPFSEWIGRFL